MRIPNEVEKTLKTACLSPTPKLLQCSGSLSKILLLQDSTTCHMSQAGQEVPGAYRDPEYCWRVYDSFPLDGAKKLWVWKVSAEETPSPTGAVLRSLKTERCSTHRKPQVQFPTSLVKGSATRGCSIPPSENLVNHCPSE